MGLLDSANQPQIQGQQQATPADQQAPSKLNPQQQQQADLAIKQATDFILDAENANNLADMAEGGDPVEAIVETAMPLMQNIYAAAQQSGHELPPEVLASIGFNVAHVMASVLALAQVITKEQVEPIAKQAFQQGIEKQNAGAQQSQQQAEQPQPQGQMMPPAAPQGV